MPDHLNKRVTRLEEKLTRLENSQPNSRHVDEEKQNPAGCNHEPTGANQPEDYPVTPFADAIKQFIKAYCANEHEGNSNQQKQLLVQRLLCLFTFLGFVAAAVYAGISYRQWNSSKHDFVVDQRPWIQVRAQADPPDSGKFTTGVTPGVPLTYPLLVSNGGKTPARNVNLKIVLDVVPSNSEPRLDLVDSKAGYPYGVLIAGIMFPNSDIVQTVTRLGENGIRPTTVEEFRSISSGNAYIAAFGIVRYDDLFGVHHWTRFCKFIGNANGSFDTRSCTIYNDSDHE